MYYISTFVTLTHIHAEINTSIKNKPVLFSYKIEHIHEIAYKRIL